MSKRKQTCDNYKEKVAKKRRNNKLFDFPEYDHPHVHTTAEPAPPPLNNGPSLIPIFPKTFSFSLVYSLSRAGINQSVSDTDVQEFLGQENGKSQPEDSESDKSTTSGETEWSRDLQYMHFSHSTNEPQCGDDDYNRLFKVHQIMYMVLSNLKHVYEPSKPMSIDKGMIAYKGHLSFRQFMPAKLTKYGVKGWMAANAKNGYISNFAVYLDQAEKNCHRIHGLGYDVVMKITEFY